MKTATKALNSSTISAATEQTIAFCVEHRITNPEEMMKIMDRTVEAIHSAECEFVAALLAGDRPEVFEAVLLNVYLKIRDEAGLEVPADVRARAERFGYRRA